MALKPPSADLFGRRDFLSRGGLLCLSAAGVAGVGIGLRALWPRAGTTSAVLVPAGRPTEYRPGQVSERLLQDHEVWIARDERGIFALSARCTHLGCKLRFLSAAAEYRCACHGSAFGLDGEVRAGPAVRPLERVFITLDSEGELLVDPAVRYRKERGEWSHPGALVRLPRRRRG